MQCPVCHAVNLPDRSRCQSCGEPLPSPQSQAAPGEETELLPVEAVAAEDAGQPVRRSEKDPDDGIVSLFIPYHNPKALAAYYCGFFALIPVIGFVLGPIAVWLGVLGVRYSSRNPAAKGMVHAITGIVLGVMAFVCWNPFWCLLLVLAYFLQYRW
jgi:hypothetical protein